MFISRYLMLNLIKVQFVRPYVCQLDANYSVFVDRIETFTSCSSELDFSHRWNFLWKIEKGQTYLNGFRLVQKHIFWKEVRGLWGQTWSVNPKMILTIETKPVCLLSGDASIFFLKNNKRGWYLLTLFLIFICLFENGIFPTKVDHRRVNTLWWAPVTFLYFIQLEKQPIWPFRGHP